MHRTQLLIEDWQYEALKALAERRRQSVSEVLREILSRHLRTRRGGSRSGIRRIEGIGADRESSGREHDRYLYQKPAGD